MKFLINLLVPALLALTACQTVTAETDFNVVGKQVAIMLQNNHYERLPLDEELSERIFEDYLGLLDSNKVYLTGEDVAQLEAKYSKRLCDLLLSQKSINAAVDIYGVFTKRVEERIGAALKMLEEDQFSFDTDETVLWDRSEAEWAANDEEAQKNWELSIRQAVLNETLRRAQISVRAEELGKPQLSEFDRSETEKIALRYKRFLLNTTEVDREDIANYFLSVVCRAHDPHTDYVSAREMERFQTAMNNQLVGIGAQLNYEDDGATVIKGIVVNGPADKQGELKLNDRIVGVAPNNGGEDDMVDILFMKLDKVVSLITGEEGTEVALKVEPADGPAGETKLIVIKRDQVQLKDEIANAQLIETSTDEGERQKMGLITLAKFYGDLDDASKRCSHDVEILLKRLMKENIDGLVIDIRGNGGGYLEEVCRMIGFFIDQGPVVQIRNTRGNIQVKDSLFRRALYDGPVVILTDRLSASASEILAGALQDYNRAVVVGEGSSFGKGTVQQHMDIARKMPFLSDSSRAGFLKPTIQKFYRVSGSSTQNEGVVPSVVVPSVTDAQEIGEKDLPHALKHDEIRPAKGFKPQSEDLLFLPTLRERSQQRIAQSQDFTYVKEDIERIRKRKAENEISLNFATRQAELEQERKREKARNKERIERFAKMAEEDHERMTIYRLNLDDVNDEVLEQVDLEKDAQSYMRRAKEDLEELDDSPEWPSGIDPVKREGLAVLSDLISVTEKAKMAGLLQQVD